jgi:hypothetical protein
VPIKPLVKVEQTMGWLGRWRRLSKCYEGSIASARTWLAVACVGQMLPRIDAYEGSASDLSAASASA